MKDSNDNLTYPGWARDFLSVWLDEEYQPSVRKIKEKNWNVLPVADVLNPMEAEWLSESIREIGTSEGLLGIYYEYGRDPIIETIPVNRDSIIEFNTNNSFRYIVITSYESDFLYYKDQKNRFYLLCGDQEFINKSYRCSYETAKLMYFDYWVENDFNSTEEKQFLTKTWHKYELIKN